MVICIATVSYSRFRDEPDQQSREVPKEAPEEICLAEQPPNAIVLQRSRRRVIRKYSSKPATANGSSNGPQGLPSASATRADGVVHDACKTANTRRRRTPFQSSMDHPSKRKSMRRRSFDLDEIVFDDSYRPKVKKPLCKEIAIPNWLLAVTIDDDVLNEDSNDYTEDIEDMSDEAFMKRHRPLELNERRLLQLNIVSGARRKKRHKPSVPRTSNSTSPVVKRSQSEGTETEARSLAATDRADHNYVKRA
ncbi:unnamed protein product [Soboliphyme baturini]|uniref:PEHE domain-containing protein n=1 Tax=Soboliphyme baturini TaxID=241478 RepID=A0A183J9J0_9BILA|nr:unnamed protein product [Soboliphyme baturini]